MRSTRPRVRPTTAPHHSGLKNCHRRQNRVPDPDAPPSQPHTSLTAKRSMDDRMFSERDKYSARTATSSA